jgi:dTDP-4-dehydrorhamnose 3,5-epimerase
MRFLPTRLDGALLIELEPHRDERGSFARLWDGALFSERGLEPGLAQVSVSSNPKTGTLRGLHFQLPPYEEAKLVRCIAGAIFDVIVDLRAGSPGYGRWEGFELTRSNGRQLYVPKGFAHGFQTLADDSEVLYFISTPYAPTAAAGLRWDDPTLGIGWPVPPRVISERDRTWPSFAGTSPFSFR